MHLDYPVRPRGVRFATSQADTDRLPDGLAQPRANYRIAFKDEFSGPGSRPDHRLWAAPSGQRLQRLRGPRRQAGADGVHDLPELGAGKMIKASLQCEVPVQVRLHRGPLLRPRRTGDDGGGHFHWHSYPRGDHWAFNGRSNVPEERARDYVSFVCRGGDARRQRARWLDTLGVEMQYIETFINRPDEYQLYWWVYHSTHPRVAERACAADPVVYSGLHWGTVGIARDEDVAHTLGVEWTPSGHRGFLNGEPYPGYFLGPALLSPGHYAHYGHSDRSVFKPAIIRYTGRDEISDTGLVDSTVSHVYQGFGMSWHPGNTRDPDDRPSGWSSTVEVDYIRVYQPVDRYSSETRTYR